VYHGALDDAQRAPLLSKTKATKMKNGLPKFKNEKEEARFWETHDSTDFQCDLEPDDETVFVRPEIGLIEVPPVTWNRLLREARRRRTTPQRLIQQWLHEKLTV
jgi:hypothetical protein